MMRILRRLIADLKSSSNWALNTVHNLVLLAVAGLLVAVVGWMLQEVFNLETAEPTPLFVILPALVVGFGLVYGTVAAWSYLRATSGSDSNSN